jgi:hypothetical protein
VSFAAETLATAAVCVIVTVCPATMRALSASPPSSSSANTAPSGPIN